MEDVKHPVDLNDDCFIKICRYLDINDLCNFAMASTRCKRIADIVFLFKQKEMPWSFETKEKIVLLLKTFGHIIT